MPDTLFLPTGVSLGLLAGIVSGVCYVFANKITWHGRTEHTNKCVAKPNKGICRKCGGEQQGGFLPCVCLSLHNKPEKFEGGAWFLRQVQRVITYMPWSISSDKLEQIEEECENEGENQNGRDLKSIRDFLETLSAQLTGGTLEKTKVASLYDHPTYEMMFERHHSALRHSLSNLANALRDALTHLPARNDGASSGSSINNSANNSASDAHAQLKRLVARVVEEAAALPALAKYAAEPPRAPSVEASTYEDLLATAILNKVIERYQHENGSGGRSSGIHSASASPTPSERSSPRSLNCRNRDITPPLREENEDVSDWEEQDEAIELPRRIPFPEFGGDIIHGIEDDANDYDEVSGSDIQAVDGSWEENWLFQKRKIKTMHSVPVPMLVPNSNTEYKVLIGDKDVDDTSDLSDNASDMEEDSLTYQSDIKTVLDSKHIIGGKTQIEEYDFEPDSLTNIDDSEEPDILPQAINDEVDGTVDTINKGLLNNYGNDKLVYSIDSGPVQKPEFNLKEEIHRMLTNEAINSNRNEMNNDKLIASNKYENNKERRDNTLNGHEKESEYEVAVTLPVQRYADSLRRKHFDEDLEMTPTHDTNTDDDLIPGSIADRERKKWLNYVEMPNNPYSPEAIQKRLMAKSTSSLFDTFTKKRNFENDKNAKSSNDICDQSTDVKIEKKTNKIEHSKSEIILNTENNDFKADRLKSPSPKMLKDVLAEDIPEFKRYGRDYYVKEAKSSHGGRKRNTFSDTSSNSSINKSASLDNFDTEFASTENLIAKFNKIAENQEYDSFVGKNGPHKSITVIENNNTQNILIEYEEDTNNTLFSAKPVLIDDDTDEKFDEIFELAQKATTETVVHIDEAKSPSLDHSILSSSSLEDSIKIYNVQTGEIVKCKPVDSISTRYDTKPDNNDNIDIPDKNSSAVLSSENISHENDLNVIVKSEMKSRSESRLSVLEEEIVLPKVKELAKIYLSMENLEDTVCKPPPRRRKSKENVLDTNSDIPSKQYMHSLTARSISKKFREELKLSMPTHLNTPGGAKELPQGIEEIIKEDTDIDTVLPAPGTIKAKLAFFEGLKAKFSTK